MDFYLIGFLALLGVFIWEFISSRKERNDSREVDGDEREEGERIGNNNNNNRAGGGGLNRMRRRIQRLGEEVGEVILEEEDLVGAIDREDDRVLAEEEAHKRAAMKAKLEAAATKGKKKEKSVLKRIQKSQSIQASIRTDEVKAGKASEASSTRIAKSEAIENEIEELRALDEKIQKEREREEEEAYQAIKKQFSIEADGVLIEEKKQFKDIENDFIATIKETKINDLDTLATKYQMTVKIILTEIQRLLSLDKLSGVIDESGKFIYISNSELESFAKIIKRRGRISIKDLMTETNKVLSH